MPISLPELLIKVVGAVCILAPLVLTSQMVRDRSPLAALAWLVAIAGCVHLLGGLSTLVALPFVWAAANHVRWSRKTTKRT